MNHRARGIRLEYVVADHLRDRGYVTIRSAGSHGPCDIVAVKQGTVLCVQAKITLSSLGSREWTELWDLAKEANGVPLVAYRPSMRTLAFSRLMGPRALRERATGLLEAFEP